MDKAALPFYARLLMAGLALFAAWAMARAWRSGVAYSDNYTFDETREPTMFIVTMLSQLFVLLFCVALAAGYTPQEFLAQFGLDRLSAGLNWFCPPQR
ncbi:MAG: hypothetical protein HY242_09495 [Afipia sp.]|nr:hypothetical protein [Afipia sp.]